MKAWEALVAKAQAGELDSFGGLVREFQDMALGDGGVPGREYWHGDSAFETWIADLARANQGAFSEEDLPSFSDCTSGSCPRSATPAKPPGHS